MDLDFEAFRKALQVYGQRKGRGVWKELQEKSGVHATNISRIARGEQNPTFSTWMSLYEACPRDFPPPGVSKGQGEGAVSLERLQVILNEEGEGGGRKAPANGGVGQQQGEGVSGDKSAAKEALIQLILEHSQSTSYSVDESLNILAKFEEATGIDLGSNDTLMMNRQIPVFNAGAGEPSHFTDGQSPVGLSEDYVTVPQNKTDANTFAVRVQGDSMAPRILPGDLAVVVPSRPLDQGKLCFATWADDDAGQRLVKRYYRYGDTIVLRSDNPEHEEITLDGSNGKNVRIFRVTMIISVED